VASGSRTLALGLALCAWSRVGLAAPGDAEAGANPDRRVELITAGDPDQTRRLQRALEDAFAARGLATIVEQRTRITSADVVDPAPRALPAPATATATATAPAPPTFAVRVLIDLTSARAATVTLTDGACRHIYVRHLVLARGFDAVARESLLFVVERSVAAMLAGQTIGVSREEYQEEYQIDVARAASANAPTPPGVTPPPTSLPLAIAAASAPRLPMTLSAGYQIAALGSDTYPHSLDLRFGLGLGRLRMAADLGLAAPFTVGDGDTGARLFNGAARVSLAAPLLSRRGLSLCAGLGAGLDLTRVRPGVTSPALRASAPFWAADLALRVFVDVEQRVGRWAIDLIVGADAYPTAERYLVAGPTGDNPVFVARQLRPVAALLFGVRL
jgi:hypothetical protein